MLIDRGYHSFLVFAFLVLEATASLGIEPVVKYVGQLFIEPKLKALWI